MIFLAVLFFTLVSMGLYRSPAVALMPDVTPNHLRSRANAVINLMGAVGGVYALIMIKVLVGKGETPDYLPLFASIAAVMAIAVGILVITIRENKLREEVEKAEAANAGTIEEKAMAEGVEAAGEIEAVGDTGEVKAFDGKKQTGKTEGTKGMPKEVKRSMYFMLASIFLWFTAYNAVTTAFSRYTKVVWKMEGGSFANCLMVATVAAILSYIPIGNISAKIGRKKTIMGGVLWIRDFCQRISPRRQCGICPDRCGMGSHQCEFLSDDRGHEQWQRCGEIHRNLLYVLYGSADPDAGTLGFSVGKRVL